MDLSYDDVIKIVRIIESSSCQELELQLGDLRLVVRRGGAVVSTAAATAVGTAAPAAAPAPATRPAAPLTSNGAAPPTGGGEAPVTAAAAARSDRDRNGQIPVKAPAVGTFYRAPAPDAPPFVEVGALVTPDDTVCIVEVMKVMNMVKAPCRGRVINICVENAALVEFGQPCMWIEPEEPS